MNITLRPLIESDKKLFYSWWNDPEIRELTSGELGTMPEKEIGQTIEKNFKDTTRTDFIIEVDAKPVGHIAILKDSHKNYYSIHIAIGEKDYWDKGIGAESLRQAVDWFWENHPNEKTLELEVNTDNPRALRCYEKVGFVKAGEKHYKKYKDTYLMRLERP